MQEIKQTKAQQHESINHLNFHHALNSPVPTPTLGPPSMKVQLSPPTSSTLPTANPLLNHAGLVGNPVYTSREFDHGDHQEMEYFPAPGRTNIRDGRLNRMPGGGNTRDFTPNAKIAPFRLLMRTSSIIGDVNSCFGSSCASLFRKWK